MTKKEFELIAGVLKYTAPHDKTSESGEAKQWLYMAHSLNETLAKNYPEFDRSKFLKACGVES